MIEKKMETKKLKVLDVFLKKKVTSKEWDYLIRRGATHSVFNGQRKRTWGHGHSETGLGELNPPRTNPTWMPH